jgi:hypothetical protein
LAFGKTATDQQKIKEYIESSIMNSGNEIAMDKFKSISKNISMIDFVFGAK